MPLWFARQRRRVEERARAVRRDGDAMAQARRRVGEGLRAELSPPAVLLALFAAGLGYGWLGPRAERPQPERDEARTPRSGRIARLTGAALAGLRLYARARRAAALVGPVEPR